MSHPEHIHEPTPEFVARAKLDPASYARDYARSIADPEGFWGEVGRRLTWIRPYTRVKDASYALENFHIRWYEDGILNVAANCLDRHLAAHGERIALIWEADEPGDSRHITYRELYEQVCRCANVLRGLGVAKGDRVTIYLPMIPEVAVAMLACARIGAVHSVIFAGFSPESIASRIEDCQSRIVITANEGLRGGKRIPLKRNVDAAIALLKAARVEHVVVVDRTDADVPLLPGRDLAYGPLMAAAAVDCEPEPMHAEDPLFILYTSGSTGKPKGVLHTTGGYLVYAAFTFDRVFDHRDEDIFWCTADAGWVTGHSYVLYGPLANGATSLMFEGTPKYPDPGRFWQICDTHRVSVLYTAPTAIRSLMAEGDHWVTAHRRDSLRLLGSVGEPINPEAWEWYHGVVGDRRCPIVDTWWQTETGGIMIVPLPGASKLKPGSAALPFFGIEPAIVDADGRVLTGACEGNLVLTGSWPGQMRTVFGDPQRFIDTYFRTYPGSYFTGDGARRDADGYYWITGRVDDVINVSGHRIGTAEVESALGSHPAVAEAAVVGYPHDIKGQGIYAYVTLKLEHEPTPALRGALLGIVRERIGAFAAPDVIQWAPVLPRTRSGKIMRRILRKIAADETDQIGDTSTLADPAVVAQLVASRPG